MSEGGYADLPDSKDKTKESLREEMERCIIEDLQRWHEDGMLDGTFNDPIGEDFNEW